MSQKTFLEICREDSVDTRCHDPRESTLPIPLESHSG